ncbi:heterokaryon incompatibility protein-domain-containing protein [Xylariaceae sp. AK1471]|nr:heterokaryon incompatibility protein-domain-containing protein [Xylariaceae sp. AK1471]
MAESSDVPEWKVDNDYSLYRPLGVSTNAREIRLVTIAPGANDDPVQCRLRRYPLPCPDTKFEALSYCWGSLTDTTTITLIHDGDAEGSREADAQEQTFNVTKSLEKALRSLRRVGEARVIWIDALCINQGSIRERNYAIAFMVDVYKAADQVVIYLGDEFEGGAFGAFWDILGMVRAGLERSGRADLWERDQSDINAAVDGLRVVPNEGTRGGTSMFEVQSRIAFSAFFKYSWFQRVWVVQEAMYAKSAIVQCGKRQRNWVEILAMLHWATRSSRTYTGNLGPQTQDLLPPFLWTKLHNSRGHENEPSAYLPFLDVIAGGRAFYSTDPRDKIFALLSFGEETHDLARLSPRLKPDYGKPASVAWMDLTRQWIIDHRSLDILGVIREKVDQNNQVAEKTLVVSDKKGSGVNHAVEAPPGGHPTWALWHAEHPEAALRALFRQGDEMQKSSFILDLDILDTPPDPSALSLPGTILDRVTKVHWTFRRWSRNDDDISIADYDRSPPKRVRSGVAIVWAAVIGALSGLDVPDGEQIKISFKSAIEIAPYPNNTALIQAFVETLVCRPLSRVYFTDHAPMDLLEGEHEQKEGEEELDVGAVRADLMILAHFAAHWTRDRKIDPEMKWIPAPWAARLRSLARHGSATEFVRLCGSAEGRCFFQTQNGAFGLCPRGTVPGDVVASFAGGKTPFVVRPVDAAKATYALLGECSLHGLDIRKTTAVMASRGAFTMLNVV